MIHHFKSFAKSSLIPNHHNKGFPRLAHGRTCSKYESDTCLTHGRICQNKGLARAPKVAQIFTGVAQNFAGLAQNFAGLAQEFTGLAQEFGGLAQSQLSALSGIYWYGCLLFILGLNLG